MYKEPKNAKHGHFLHDVKPFVTGQWGMTGVKVDNLH